MLLMKRFTFWAVAVVAVMLAGTAKAQESKLLKVENYTFSKWNPETMSNELTDTPQPYGNDVNYYYDADGQLSMEYEIYPTGTSGTLKIYAYNEQGQVSSIERLSGGGQPQVTEYFYDDQGRLVKEQQNNNGFYSGYVYDEFDEHGNYTVRKMLSSDGISTGTEHHFAYTYDADGNPVPTEEYAFTSRTTTYQLNTLKLTGTTTPIDKWLPNHHYVYNLVIKPHRIEFTGQVVEWGQEVPFVVSPEAS